MFHLPCVGGDWILLAGRVAPFLVIIFMVGAVCGCEAVGGGWVSFARQLDG